MARSLWWRFENIRHGSTTRLRCLLSGANLYVLSNIMALPSFVAEAAVVAIATISCLKLPANLATATALASEIFAAILAAAVAFAATTGAISRPVAILATIEACSSTSAETLSSTFAFAAATEALAPAEACATGATRNVRCVGLALHVVPPLVVAHCITFNQILTIGKLVPVYEKVLISVVLCYEAETLSVVEKLDDSCLAHGFNFDNDKVNSWTGVEGELLLRSVALNPSDYLNPNCLSHPRM
mmetsp:Transcript_7268/g.18165  ORF Transcript_7268/g.18165 Transcript_7268/m.18165 type:complete len:244 (-) Transcript_7268:14-745(-)